MQVELCNQLNTGPLHRGNSFITKGLARVNQRMQWEAPFKPLALDDPLLLLEREVHVEIGMNWLFDQDIPSHSKGECFRILE